MTETTNTEFQPGDALGGRYEVICRLGRGGMGLVYKVRQIFLNKEFALKTIEKHSMSEIAVRRFQQEARTTFSVSHPNIIAVHDFGVLDDQTPFLVMELINGETLAERLKRVGCLPVQQAIPIFVQICFGLAYAHECGIVHRDIKPSNIMLLNGLPLGSDGSIKILDFGIAKFTAHEGGEVQALTRTGEIFGSPLYMSPEQCSGLKIDHRADIYSLGCVFFEVLTGTPPFIEESALTTMLKHQSEEPPTLKQASMGAEFPKTLQDIITRMLAKSPDARYQNLGWVAHDLGAVNRGDTLLQTVQPVKPEEKVVSMKRSTFAALIMSSAVVSLLAGIGGYILHPGGRAKQIKHVAPEFVALPNVAMDGEVTDKSLRDLLADELAAVKSGKATQADRFALMPGSILNAEAFKLIAENDWIHYLDLRNCNLDNESLDCLSKLDLNTIDVSKTNFDDKGAEKLSSCPSVTTLYAKETGITDDGLRSLASMKNLKKLTVAFTKVTSRGLSALTTSHVDDLNLKGSDIDDAGMDSLSQMDKLFTVTLSKTKITVDGLKKLCKSRSLRVIEASDCPGITYRELSQLTSLFPNISFSALPGAAKDRAQVAGSENLNRLLAEGKNAEAEPLLVRELQADEKNLGTHSPYLAGWCVRLGSCYVKQRKFAQAETQYKRAVAIYEQTCAANDRRVPDSLTQLGWCFTAQRKTKEAESQFKRALPLYGNIILEPKDEALAVLLISLGDCSYLQGRMEEAVQYYSRALTNYEKTAGPESLRVADTLNHLGTCYQKLGQLSKFAECWSRAVKIYDEKLSPNDPRITAVNLMKATLAKLAPADGAAAK